MKRISLLLLLLICFMFCGCESDEPSDEEKNEYSTWSKRMTCTSTSSKYYDAIFVIDLGYNEDESKLEHLVYTTKYNKDSIKYDYVQMMSELQNSCSNHLKDTSENGKVLECKIGYKDNYYIQTITYKENNFAIFLETDSFNSKDEVMKVLESGTWNKGLSGKFLCY